MIETPHSVIEFPVRHVVGLEYLSPSTNRSSRTDDTGSVRF